MCTSVSHGFSLRLRLQGREEEARDWMQRCHAHRGERGRPPLGLTRRPEGEEKVWNRTLQCAWANCWFGSVIIYNIYIYTHYINYSNQNSRKLHGWAGRSFNGPPIPFLFTSQSKGSSTRFWTARLQVEWLGAFCTGAHCRVVARESNPVKSYNLSPRLWSCSLSGLSSTSLFTCEASPSRSR